MKMLVRIVAILSGVVLLLLATIFGWLYLYTGDLPRVSILDQYAPLTKSEIRTGAGSVAHVVPADQLGKYLPSAVLAAEGQPDPRGPIRVALASLVRDTAPRGQMYSWQIARDMVPPGRALRSQTSELRLAQQIYRRFNQQQILTIFMNRIFFGQDINGVEDASIRYFGKPVSDLSLEETALIAGLIRSPNHDSPINHPERAVQRRNWVLDNMIRQGSTPQADAERAKAAPLIIKRIANADATYDWKKGARCLADVARHRDHGPIQRASISGLRAQTSLQQSCTRHPQTSTPAGMPR